MLLSAYQMLRPTISIITPTFNAATTIARCLESVARQTYRPIEHWIIDGESTDATLSIVKEFVQEHDHVHYISKPDQGIYDAMNKGIALAQGDWVYFLGGDDVFFTDHVLNQLFSQKAYPEEDVVYGDVFSTRFSGTYDGAFDEDKIIQKNICHQAIFFRKSLFLITGNFNLRFKSHADWDHNLKWFLNSKVRRKYVSLTVANYADGGFSSLNLDHEFSNLLPLLALAYDQKTLSSKQKAKLAKASAKRFLKRGKILSFFRYSLLYAKLAWQANLT